MGINEKARELASAIMGTREYNELKQARNAIDSKREVKSKMDDFKAREKSLYDTRLSPKDAEAKAAELNKLFQDLSKIPEVDRYIKAEKEFTNVLNQAYKTVSDTLESGIKTR